MRDSHLSTVSTVSDVTTIIGMPVSSALVSIIAVGYISPVSIRHFVDCVVNDKEPMVTGEDGLAATRIICAIQESSRKGEPVELDSSL